MEEASPSVRSHPSWALLGLLVYVGAFLVLGGLLTFPAYVWLGAGTVPLDSVLHRVVGVTALVLLPLYLAGARCVDRRTLGFGCARRAFAGAAAKGFVLGAALVTPLVAGFLLLGVRVVTWSTAPPAFAAAGLAAAALAAALLIGIVEEAYFRGALLGALRRSLPVWAAACITSVLYAALHFVGGPVSDGDVRWLAGLASIGRSDFELDAFLALTAGGLLLAAMRLRYDHVALGAGFHAGWVWVMKLAQEYTDVNPESPLLFLEGAYAGTMGYLGLAWIAVLGGAWYAWVRRRGPSAAEARGAPGSQRAAVRCSGSA
ncbi:MAG TPA: CPBP family intramembrane glutamic endopeptidase [Gammaproteobacteria bacterium]